MSSNESRRVAILARVAEGVLTRKQAAQLLGLSYRQAKRLCQRYQRHGLAGLVHGHTGHRSNRAKPVEVREQALEFVRQKGSDSLSPTMAAAELESERGLVVNQQTLRRWMLEAGLRTGSRKRPEHSQNTRSAHFGERLLLRGRVCSWPEERRAVNWIVELFDDATETITLCVTREPVWALAGALRVWIEHYGIPCAMEVDWNRIGMREPPSAFSNGPTPVTHFRKMCGRLNIPLVATTASDARGQPLEAHWNRLLADFRDRSINSDKAANAYLEVEYVPEHNAQFARSTAMSADFHRPVAKGLDLSAVFRVEEERPISNDWTVSYRGRLYEVQRESRYRPARDRVVVHEWPDGRLEIHYRGRAVKWRRLPADSEIAGNRRWNAPTVNLPGTFLSSEQGDISIERTLGTILTSANSRSRIDNPIRECETRKDSHDEKGRSR